MSNRTIVDRRVLPEGVDRRDERSSRMPPGGPRGGKVVRSRAGRRSTDPQPARTFSYEPPARRRLAVGTGDVMASGQRVVWPEGRPRFVA